MLKKLFIMLLCPLMALPLVSCSIASTVSASAKPSSNGIVGEWMWGSSIADAGKDGAEKIMTRCAELGITDVYLLVKGTGGKLGYLRTKYTSSLSRTDRDILQEAIDAAHPKGIRIHAWICNMEDTAYKEAHNDAGMWHYIRARDNNKINLYDPGYLEYMTTVAKELAAYDIDGLHFDYIRYNHLANGWGENDFEALKRMGADIDRVKELIETTFGYHDKTASSDYIFNAYNNGDKDARLIAEYRRNNVKSYAMAVIAAAKAIKPNLIISAATMPEGAYSEAFAHLHYGQSYEDAALLYDYICPMGYSTNYGQSAAWPITLTENAIKMGNKVVMGLQAYEKATSDRLMSEIAGINYLRADKSYTDSALGVVFFRTGTLDYAKATYDNDKKIITVKMYNSAATSALSRVQIDVQDGIKITGASVGEGFENGTDIKFAKNGTYVRFTGKDILKGGKDGYLYLKYEGDINKESAPASVTASRTNTLIVYTATFSSNDEKADMGVPGDFTEPAVETTTDKVTTTEVTTLPDADETTALNNGNGQIANPETTASENKRNGCGSLISGGLTSVTAALTGIFAIKKKKKESKK